VEAEVDTAFAYGSKITVKPGIARLRLIDPNTGLDAEIPDESNAIPTVGRDGDVYARPDQARVRCLDAGSNAQMRSLSIQYKSLRFSHTF
jgi:hypothetical protein